MAQSRSERIKATLDWLQHCYWIGTFLASLGIGRAGMAWLARHANLARDWETAIWLTLSGLCLWLATFIGNKLFIKRKKVPYQNMAEPSIASAVLNPAIPSPIQSPINTEQFFRFAYQGQLQTETEGNVRLMVQSRPPNERDEFIVRFIATGIVNAFYEHLWFTIFRSEILALNELNNALVRLEQIRKYYDDAVRKYPEFYANFSFEQWLGYLRSQALLLEHPGQVLEITVRGKDFLKYMVHCGYSAESHTH